MPEAYGLGAFVEGMRAAQSDQQAKVRAAQETQLFQLSLQEGELKVKNMEMKFDEAKALADAQKEAGQMLKVARAKADPNAPQDYLNQQITAITTAANSLFEKGQFVAGTELLQSADAIAKNNYAVLERAQRVASEKAERVATLLEGVDNPAQFQQNVLADAGYHPNDPLDPKITQQLIQFPYDPKDPESIQRFHDVRDSLIRASRTGKEATEIALKKAETDGHIFDTQHLKPSQEKLNEARAERERQLAIQGKKDGKLDLVPQALISEATVILKSKFPLEGQLDPANLQRLAVPIAESARRLMQDNRGMLQSVALETVVKQRENGPDFVGLRKGSAPAGTADRPAAPPTTVQNGKTVLDPAKMIDKRVYQIGPAAYYWDARTKKLIPTTVPTDEPADAPVYVPPPDDGTP